MLPEQSLNDEELSDHDPIPRRQNIALLGEINLGVFLVSRNSYSNPISFACPSVKLSDVPFSHITSPKEDLEIILSVLQ